MARARQRYEYEVRFNVHRDRLDDVLSHYGGQGWRAISFDWGSSGTVSFVLEREAAPAPRGPGAPGVQPAPYIEVT